MTMCATGSPVCLLRASRALMRVSEMSHASVGTMGLLLRSGRDARRRIRYMKHDRPAHRRVGVVMCGGLDNGGASRRRIEALDDCDLPASGIRRKDFSATRTRNLDSAAPRCGTVEIPL